MSSNGYQLTKKDSSLRRRKSVIASAGVKHRLNCLSTLSALQSHSSSAVKKNRALSRGMSKPTKTTAKKSQDNYVIRLGSQQLMQQFTKSGSSMVVKQDDQDPELNLTLQQKIKFFFVLLMIPSAMVVFFGSNKFNNTSSVSIDPNVQLLGAMGGMGGMGGLGGMAGLPRGFPGGFGGFPGGHDSEARRHGSHPPESMRRHYDDYDPKSIEDHLERMSRNTPNREQNRKIKSRSKPQRSESTQRSSQSNSEITAPDFSSHELNEVNEQNMGKVSDSNPNSDSVKQNLQNTERSDGNHKNSDQTQKQNKETKDRNIGMGDRNTASTFTSIKSEKSTAFEETIPAEPEFKTILLWTPIDGSVDGRQPFIDSKCVINKCIFTFNKSESSRSDAIVFNARHVTTGGLPNMRSSHQKWILFSSRPPDSNSGESLIPVSNLFDWSWTYRPDSHIVYNYANVKQMSVESNQLFKASDIFYIWRQKTKMILWFANNCQTNTKRENYVKELTDHIDIDIYGKCSQLNHNIDIVDQNQMKGLSEKYLFVITFEKNDCKDYVSERLFKYLEHNMIPIVMGGADYSKIVPPNSVINAKDFTSAKDLADFVLDIGSDFQKYKKYFEWKRNHQITYDRKDFCQLCYKLHDEDSRSKTNFDIIKWWLDSIQC